MPRHPSIYVALLLLVSTGCTPSPDHQVFALQGATMGTEYSVQIVDPPSGIEPRDLQTRIDRELEWVNNLMSTYREGSELSRFNRSRSREWFAVSPALASLVQEALRTSEASSGAFDTTVGPLVNLWGFGPGTGLDAVPSDQQIEAVRARVGHQKLKVRRDPPALQKSEPDLYLDLSAIAKGFGVDRVADLLERAGLENYLVEIGGELRGRGYNGRGQPWRIAVERPTPGAREVHRVVELSEGAMATSGDYRNFFEIGGTLYSHTIDPRTGRPVGHALASVTVLAPTAARADALATAFLVLGPNEGPALAQSLQTAALFILRTADDFEELWTSAFQSYLSEGRPAE